MVLFDHETDRFFHLPRVGVRISDAVAVAMLFWLGYAYGSYAKHRPWEWAASMVGPGALMVCLTIAEGG
jgi:VIT1/CCC1 family predicted Fe2+/Mn2+ transporter